MHILNLFFKISVKRIKKSPIVWSLWMLSWQLFTRKKEQTRISALSIEYRRTQSAHIFDAPALLWDAAESTPASLRNENNKSIHNIFYTWRSKTAIIFEDSLLKTLPDHLRLAKGRSSLQEFWNHFSNFLKDDFGFWQIMPWALSRSCFPSKSSHCLGSSPPSWCTQREIKWR